MREHIRTVIDLRRGLDLLIARPDVKEWIEDQIASAAGQKSGAAGGELQMLRQSMERIEAKVDRIEKVLDGISE